MQNQRYTHTTKIPNPGPNIVPDGGVSSPLGSNANKVANTEPQQVTNKPLRDKLFSLRTANRRHKIVSQRTQDCGCKTIGHHAELNLNPRHSSVNITNIETCASVWQCPVCRAKIQQGRADQLRLLQQRFEADGGHTFMLTFTLPHYHGQGLRGLLGSHKDKAGLSGAIARMRQHRTWRDFKAQAGYMADCRAMEVTHGDNGFHPHVHMIVYTTKPADLPRAQAMLSPLWADCCEAAGMDRPNEHGVRATKGVSDYLAKWGAASELSSDAVKQAKNGNRSVAQLESFMLTDPDSVKGILKEYYQAMKGRKLLTWAGENIRDLYLDDDVTDLELATDDHGQGRKLFNIHRTTWLQIYNTGRIGRMLSMVENSPQTGLFDFLQAYNIDPGGVTRHIVDMPPELTIFDPINRHWEN